MPDQATLQRWSKWLWRLRGTHYVDIMARINGQDKHFEGDWLRELLDYALRQVERHCPCGARPEMLSTHPHVTGCPVGEAFALPPAPSPSGPAGASA